VGHLLQRIGEDAAGRGIDARHEAIGAGYLARWFPEALVQPVRLHVEAKRYLCSAEPGYFAELSSASVQSLALQGGPLTPDAAAAFLARPYAADSVLLRRWDEEAKRPGALTPPLSVFLAHVERALSSPGPAPAPSI
jgi:[1-hydroxy-2-(trimethylamino)ethyl]phosphonate dioxygenase